MTEQETLPAVVDPRALALVSEPAPVEALLGQMRAIHEAMSRAMSAGEHYGVIPGTKSKPTLMKAGAEKLCLLFRLRPQYHVTRHDLPNGHREYEIVTDLINVDGQVIGQGVGLCSTMESRYRYRTGKRRCPQCGAEAIIKGKQEYGGGYICFRKQGGCGAKYADGDAAIEGQLSGQVDNPDIADCLNTVLKMAKKRSLVDGILTVTAASDVFTQDLEETVPDAVPEAPPPPPPPAPTQPVTQANGDRMTGEQQSRYVLALGRMRRDYAFVWDTALEQCGYTDEQLAAMVSKSQSRQAYTALQTACESLAPPLPEDDADLSVEPQLEEVQP